MVTKYNIDENVYFLENNNFYDLIIKNGFDNIDDIFNYIIQKARVKSIKIQYSETIYYDLENKFYDDYRMYEDVKEDKIFGNNEIEAKKEFVNLLKLSNDILLNKCDIISQSIKNFNNGE